MSHPDPTRDYDDFDMMAEQTIWPWIDDESHDRDDANYDDHDDFFDEDSSNYHPDASHELSTHVDDDGWDEEEDDVWCDEYDDSMDGDAESAFGSCGWGVDEQYGYYGEDY